MDEPSASQAAPSVSPIFVTSEGTPLRIYVEATNIQGRPQLVRSLKKYGATICHEPDTAGILLVDPESSQGRMSIRNWGEEADKVVLDYTWANKCINAKAAFLDDDYGGCLTHDDGLPIGENDDGENEVPANPLPTPRPTPIEPPTKNQFAKQQQASQTARRSQSRAASSAFEADPNRGSAPPPVPTPNILPIGQNMPGAGVFPGGMNALMGSAAGGTPVMPPMGMNMNMTPQQQMQMYFFNQQMLLQQMAAAQSGLNPQQAMSMNDPLWLSMQDNILRTMMQNQLQQQSAAFPQFQQQQQQPVLTASPVEEQALPFPSVPRSSKKSRQAMDMEVDSDEGSDSPPSPPPPPKPVSAKRVVKDKKAKAKAASPPPPPPSKRRKTSSSTFEQGSSSRPASRPVQRSSMPELPSDGSSKKLFTQRSGREIKFYVQIGGHNRFNIVRSIKGNGGGIVDSIELANYVVLFPGVKTDKEHNVYMRQAAANGVPVVTPKFVNECIEEGIVLDPEEYLFEPIKKIRKRARALSDAALEARNRSPIDPESEDEDEDEAEAEDEDTPSPAIPPAPAPKPKPAPYSSSSSAPVKPKSKPSLYDDEPKKKKADKSDSDKKRRVSSGSGTQEILMAARDSQLSPAKPSSSQHREKKVNGTSSASAKPAAVAARPKEPPSPIPPPESTRIPHYKGFKYSKEEDDFALEYARVMWERDYRTSMSAITNAIQKKMPHHTLASWRTHLGMAQYTAQFDELRKRAGIAYRKAQSGKQHQQSAPPMEEEPAAAFIPAYQEEEKPPASPSPTPTPVPVQNNDLEDDLNMIAKFFADGNDDQTEAEEVIWARLTAQAPCKTKAKWDDFYQTHSEEVQKRYQALLDAGEGAI